MPALLSESSWKYKTTSFLLTTLVSTISVNIVGETSGREEQETGSFLVAWGSSMIGGLGSAGLVLRIMSLPVAVRRHMYKSGCFTFTYVFPPLLVLSAAPSIGTVVGYNMTRNIRDRRIEQRRQHLRFA